jgi:two-component system nitrogen regulation sensor histidine kinase GlnL
LAPLAQESTRSVLTQIESAACEMSRRLDTLLCRQVRTLHGRRVDLVRLIGEAVRRVALVYPMRRFETTHAHARLPLVGDSVRLVSLIENLLDNAARATGEAGRIAVRSELLAPRPAAGVVRMRFEVEDDGAGIPPDLADEIFEPGVGTFCGGFGLGLALCRDVVSLHCGEIEVESQPGRTVFRVVLPQVPDEVLP